MAKLVTSCQIALTMINVKHKVLYPKILVRQKMFTGSDSPISIKDYFNPPMRNGQNLWDYQYFE